LGAPQIGQSFKWTFDVHNLVNRKLEKQRIEKYLAHKNWPQAVKDDLLRSGNELYATPTIEVVLKRQIVSSDDSVSWAKLSTALLAIVMGIEDKSSEQHLMQNLMHQFRIFISSIQESVKLSKQNSKAGILVALEGLQKMIEFGPHKCKMFLERIKYNVTSAPEISELIRAGSCVKGTCV
jgi:hypothetical protein